MENEQKLQNSGSEKEFVSRNRKHNYDIIIGIAVSTQYGTPNTKRTKPKRSTPVLKVTTEERARQIKTELYAMLKANLANQGLATIITVHIVFCILVSYVYCIL